MQQPSQEEDLANQMGNMPASNVSSESNWDFIGAEAG